MTQIGQIAPNLAAKGNIDGEELAFFDVRQPPFSLYGLLPGGEGEPFRRLPLEVARQCGEGVLALHTNTAGGRARFSTDSDIVAIRAEMPGKCLMPHQPFLGSSGFTLYLNEGEESHYFGSFMPPVDRGAGYASLLRFPDRARRDITIYFPLYDNVDRLEIGLRPGAAPASGGGYRPGPPVLFYGSSITQGGCASRPGNSYQGFISRALGCDYWNLGFSGNAKGEAAMAEYIAGQPMSLFFMDYDHNSPSAEHLAKTHEPFFRIIREKNPDLPIILASKTDPPRSPDQAEEQKRRREIILGVYGNALARGDKNVRFIDGSKVFSCLSGQGFPPDSCTVDGCHPNDLGFLAMAKVFGQEIGRMLAIAQ